MSNFERMIPTESRALRIQGTGATVAGTTNTNIVAFTAAAALWQSSPGILPAVTRYPIGATFVAPTEGSGNWLNTVNSATAGTGFKFNRRGVYLAKIDAEGTDGDTGNCQLAITLDSAAAQDVVGAGTVSALSDIVLGWQNTNGVAAVGLPCNVVAPVYVTDTLAGGAQPSADLTTTRGVGVLRFFANNAGNGLVATALIVASIRATITYQGDLIG